MKSEHPQDGKDLTQSMVMWIITHLLVFGIIHNGTRSMWVDRHTLRTRFRRNALNLPFSQEEEFVGGSLGSRQLLGEFGMVTRAELYFRDIGGILLE